MCSVSLFILFRIIDAEKDFNLILRVIIGQPIIFVW